MPVKKLADITAAVTELPKPPAHPNCRCEVKGTGTVSQPIGSQVAESQYFMNGTSITFHSGGWNIPLNPEFGSDAAGAALLESSVKNAEENSKKKPILIPSERVKRKFDLED